MILTEESYIHKINSYSKKDWEPLTKLILDIGITDKFGKLAGGEKNEDGVLTIPYWEQSLITSKFLDAVYQIPIIISFDWGSWDKGREMASDSNFDFDTIDIPTKCKVITAIVRSDRFCDGALVSAFESGLILKILKSIEKKVPDEE